jgi:hypothetical protein
MTGRALLPLPLIVIAIIAVASLSSAFAADSAILPSPQPGTFLSPSLTATTTPAFLSLQTSPEPAEIVWTLVPGPSKKCPINDDYYFKYEFSEKPKMGMVILKIQVFDNDKKQVVPFKAVGRTDMPAMRGAHDSGDVEFRVNKFNNYLLPINVVMPGDWEIQVVFLLNDKAVFHGSIRFDV